MHLIDEIVQLILQVQQRWQSFVDTVNRVLSFVPTALQWVLDEINRVWQRVIQMWDDFWAGVNTIIESFGDPAGVSAQSENWISSVATPSGSIASTVTAGQLATDDDSWSGDAATKYKNRATEQHATIAAIGETIATKVVAALDALRTAMFVFYGAIIAAFAALIAGIVGGLASSATIVGIPAGVLIIIAAGGVAVAAILGAGWNLGNTIQTQSNNMRLSITGANVTRWPEFVV
ncbi:hypothetical protein [Occultella gossypii]|uniref:Phage tail tape measure protein n=1 Tax=Occultella gossypii TaxID=2800820 RepID=A0ABS7S4U2_9MICO|nr:hypothetical protein [Occultella gossypii]MBZ2195320.1 hypothetical protein [Occultella gossypii]